MNMTLEAAREIVAGIRECGGACETCNSAVATLKEAGELRSDF